MRGTTGSKPIYLRGLPAQLVREAKAIAARRGITLASFVAEAIVRAIEQSGSATQAEPASDASADPYDLASEMRWFEQHHERLAREHTGQYVAIIQHAVIDHDADFDALARRVFARVGSRNVFMPLVNPKAMPLRVRSPRLSGGQDATRSRPTRATRAR